MASEVGTFAAFTDDADNGGGFAWADEANAYANDGSDATCVDPSPAAGKSYLLHLYTMGISTPADGDTGDGLEFAVHRYYSAVGVNADDFWARTEGGAASVNNEAGGAWPSSETEDVKGGAAETWGEAWTGADLKHAVTGCMIECTVAGYGTANIDAIIPTVHFTLAAAPEIAVTGNGQNIADGDGTPSVTDDTDFGEQVESSGTHDHVFTITNSGDANLTLENVVLGGANADQFSIQEQPASPITPAGTDTFTIRFEPTSTGVKSATLSMPNNDADENPFNFSIAGTGTAAATSNSILLAARYRGLIVRD